MAHSSLASRQNVWRVRVRRSGHDRGCTVEAVARDIDLFCGRNLPIPQYLTVPLVHAECQRRFPTAVLSELFAPTAESYLGKLCV